MGAVGTSSTIVVVTAIDGANENLMSVFQFVERLGFTFIVTPVSARQFTGFYKFDGPECTRIPSLFSFVLFSFLLFLFWNAIDLHFVRWFHRVGERVS